MYKSGMTGVSFVVTVYNKARFLAPVLGAIFGQQGDFEREYIFIDDGSTDGSFERMEKLCAGRTDTRLIRQKNAGPAKATNAAVKAAKLPWLKIVDGDDLLAPWCTQSLIEAASRLGAKFALGSNVYYGAEGPEIFARARRAETAPRKRDLFAECLKNAPCNLTPTLIDRALYWDVGGCDERLFTQDFSLLLRLSWRESPAMVDGVVSASPEESGNRVSGNQRLMLKEINQAMLYFLADHPGLPWRQRRIALERAFGRAWKWRRRRMGASIGSRWFWLYALAKLAPPGLGAAFLHQTLDAFAETDKAP
jgi:glycosyltransferase involved in cell wall biosynthesis